MMMMIYGPFPPLLLSGLEISGGGGGGGGGVSFSVF